MTKSAQEALDYFNKVTTEKPLDPCVKSALKLYTDFISKCSRKGYEFTFESSGYSSIILFKKWHQSGMKGGIKKFQEGLHRCLRWSMVKIVPRSFQTVSGIDSNGQPHFRILRGCPANLTKLQASELAKKWNQEAKDSNSEYRFTYFRNKRNSSEFYKVRRYKIAFQFASVGSLSLDSQSFDSIGTDEYGDYSGSLTDFETDSYHAEWR